jgi:hypothetical protein
MNIISTSNKDLLSALTGSKILVIPLLSNYKVHYLHNQLSCVYIFDLNTFNEYTIGINHTDLPRNSQDILLEITAEQIYCYKPRYLTAFKDSIDIELLYWYYNNSKIYDAEFHSDILTIYTRWFKHIPNLNDCIPITKIYEYFRSIRANFQLDIADLEIDAGYKYYHSTVLANLIRLEQNGMKLDPIITPDVLHITDDMIYGYHELTSMTGRPSNHFQRINFLALSKKDETRKCFISRFDGGKLVELDFNSFHPYLISKLINYDFKGENPYVYLARKYFGNVLINHEMYNLAKEITFRAIYGQQIEQYSEIDFIKQIGEFTDKLWREFNTIGFIKTPLAKRKIQKSFFKALTKNTLFNYFLQGIETEVMCKMLDVVVKNATERVVPILYTYDSILLDIDEKNSGFLELDNIYNSINVMQFPYTIKTGTTYKDIK